MNEKKNKKILWIEDNYRNLKGLVKPLIKRGFEIIPARCYEEAMDELSKEL